MQQYSYLDSPIGPLLLTGDKHALHGVYFSTGKMARGAEEGWERYDEPFRRARKQLKEYFAGERKVFELSLAPAGTAFQLSVLEALQEIPYGETRSYREIADRLGNPRAVRAVGTANGRNPIPIIIPCHRVIGSDGSMTGFGGGLETKRYLLRLETQNSGLFAGLTAGPLR